MEHLNIKNLRFHADHIRIYRNSVLQNELKFSELKSLDVIQRRNKRWHLIVVFGIILILAGMLILLQAIKLFLNEIAFRSATVFVALAGISAMLIYLGVDALRQSGFRELLIINGTVEVEIEKNEIEKLTLILENLNKHISRPYNQ